MKKLTYKEVKKAAKFTKLEIDLINDLGDALFAHDVRPVVALALASHILGTVIRGSEGNLSKETAIDLVSNGVEL